MSYSHPADMIQQWTEICLRCGKNIYDSDKCIAPPVQNKAKFKRGDIVEWTRPRETTLHLTSPWRIEHSKEKQTDYRAIYGECKYHYNCYKSVDKPNSSFMHDMCIPFNEVKKAKDYIQWESGYKIGDVVLAPNPGAKSHPTKFGLTKLHYGGRSGEEYIEFTLLMHSVGEGYWYCSTPSAYNWREGWADDVTKLVIHEKDFK